MIKINESIYPININCELIENGKLSYISELEGTTISTFSYHTKYSGDTIEQSLEKIATEIDRAIKELLN
jgi:hypothetical protein